MQPPATEAPDYPQYQQLAEEAKARAARIRFVDPANLTPEAGAVNRRGGDWALAVLGFAYGGPSTITMWEQQLLLLADERDVQPPLPEHVVAARAARQERQRISDARNNAQRQRDSDRWTQVLAAANVELDVHLGTRTRGHYQLVNAHAVPRVDVYSGIRSVRTHPRGRALCESPARAKPLQIGRNPAPEGTPATCVRCLEWVPKVRAAAANEISKKGSNR